MAYWAIKYTAVLLLVLTLIASCAPNSEPAPAPIPEPDSEELPGFDFEIPPEFENMTMEELEKELAENYLIVPTNLSNDTLRIGVVIPLSGPSAQYGEYVRSGLEMAAKSTNVEFIYEDGVCLPKQAVTAITKLINVDGVKVIIGEVCSSATLAIAPIAQEQGVLLMAPSSTDPRIPKTGELILRNWFNNDMEMQGLAEVIEDDFGMSRIAILATQNEWGNARVSAFGGEFSGELYTEYHLQDASDTRTELAKLQKNNPEGVVLIGYHADMLLALKQMEELGFSVPIFASTTASTPDFIDEAGELAEGIIYVGPKIEMLPAFVEDYKETYGEEPFQTAATSFDAARLLFDAYTKVGLDPVYMKEYIIAVQEIQGASGTYKFTSEGDIVREKEVYIIQGGESLVVE